MPGTDKNFELRSGEVQEIISRPPNWIIRWGITLVFLLIILFLIVTRMISYPDVVEGDLTLTTLHSIENKKDIYKAQLSVSRDKVNRIKKGQTVLIRLDYYSPQEDVLTGKVGKIKWYAEKGIYLVEVTSIRKQPTNQRKEIAFDSQMMGSAKIITNKISLFSRISGSFANAFGR